MFLFACDGVTINSACCNQDWSRSVLAHRAARLASPRLGRFFKNECLFAEARGRAPSSRFASRVGIFLCQCARIVAKTSRLPLLQSLPKPRCRLRYKTFLLSRCLALLPVLAAISPSALYPTWNLIPAQKKTSACLCHSQSLIGTVTEPTRTVKSSWKNIRMQRDVDALIESCYIPAIQNRRHGNRARQVYTSRIRTSILSRYVRASRYRGFRNQLHCIIK